MTPDDFSEELYRDFDWRWDELRRLNNLLSLEPNEEEREGLRKSLVIVLYAHFEGFCVFALEHYLAEVNHAKVRCSEAQSSVVAGSWEKLFNAMEHGDAKCRIFIKPLPSDEKLHRHWRRRHFVEEITRFFALPVHMDDDLIDTESNLKPEVLQRNLFLLGLDHSFVNPYAATIQNLLGRRNRLAHGEDRRGVAAKEYAEYEDAVFEICYQLIEFLELAQRDKKYFALAPEFTV